MPFAISSDGVRIAYETAGHGNPVLLVHGFASSRVQNWRATGWYAALEGAGFRIIAFDCRGHGESDKPHEPHAYGEKMVDDILAVLDAGGEPAADVMGYSMGGMLAIRLLMKYPERVRRAVVAGVGADYFHEAPLRRIAIAEALEAPDAAALTDPIQKMFRAFAAQKGKDLAALAACMREPRRVYSPEELKRSTRPVLVVCGEKDVISGPAGPLAAAFADGRAITLPDRDHMSAVGDKSYKLAAVEFLTE